MVKGEIDVIDGAVALLGDVVTGTRSMSEGNTVCSTAGARVLEQLEQVRCEASAAAPSVLRGEAAQPSTMKVHSPKAELLADAVPVLSDVLSDAVVVDESAWLRIRDEASASLRRNKLWRSGND